MESIMRTFRLIFVICICTVTMLFLFSNFPVINRTIFPKNPAKEIESMKVATYEKHLLTRGFTYEQIRNMSILGKWLLAPEGSLPPATKSKKSYLILIWRYGKYLAKRHLKRYSDKTYSPWENCSVQNCILSYEDEDLHRADAVIFHLQFISYTSNMPVRSRTDQRWIMLTDESPMYLSIRSLFQRISDFDGLFNWTMTYRTHSDVPVPYGRTLKKKAPTSIQHHSQIFKRFQEADVMSSKTKLLAIMISHCGGKNQRLEYVKTLKLFFRDHLDVIGNCMDGNNTVCPRHHYSMDCPALNSYKFYLSFENSNCREYITEKVFWNAFHKYTVPIIMGASREDCRRLLPPGSYLHVDNFANVNTLADYLLYLNSNNERYLEYHKWRVNYIVLNEHGYFGSISQHYCRACEALNYNSNVTKIYEKLDDFWNNRDCSKFSDSRI